MRATSLIVRSPRFMTAPPLEADPRQIVNPLRVAVTPRATVNTLSTPSPVIVKAAELGASRL